MPGQRSRDPLHCATAGCKSFPEPRSPWCLECELGGIDNQQGHPGQQSPLMRDYRFVCVMCGIDKWTKAAGAVPAFNPKCQTCGGLVIVDDDNVLVRHEAPEYRLNTVNARNFRRMEEQRLRYAG